jgi:hypothetical protein
MTASRPTLAELRARLADAEDEYGRCQYIDHWPSALACRDRWRSTIDRLTAEITRIESEDDSRADRMAGLWKAGRTDEGD